MRLPAGCAFHPRCSFAQQDCLVAPIPLLAVAERRASACLHHDRLVQVPHG
jgi:ABC-type antimicrobial peptide transport system ATPase subunit